MLPKIAAASPEQHRPAWSRIALSSIAGVLCLAAASPVAAADADTGRTLALRWCSACHLVATDQPSATSGSLPSFFDIAEDPDWSEETLSTFLANPHPKMPDMTLGTQEIADLAAYIGTLSR